MLHLLIKKNMYQGLGMTEAVDESYGSLEVKER